MKTIYCAILSMDIVQARCEPVNNRKCRNCEHSSVKHNDPLKKQLKRRKKRSVPSLNYDPPTTLPNSDYQGDAVLSKIDHSIGFTEKDILPILEIIGLKKEYKWTEKTTEKLNWFTTCFLADEKFDKEIPRPPEIRESLKILHGRGFAFAEALEQIDFVTQYNHLKKSSVYLDLLRKIILRFVSDTKEAYESVPDRKSGKNAALREYVYLLSNIFFEITSHLPGQPFIGSSGYFSGPFFRFVESILTHIGLNISNSALGGEIKRLLTDMQKRGLSPFPGTPKRISK